MAIDQTEKRRALARRCVQHSPMLMDILYALSAIKSQRDNGGPGGTPLVFVDPDFILQEGLTHVDAAMIDVFFAAIPTVLQAFANQNFNDAFEAMRP